MSVNLLAQLRAFVKYYFKSGLVSLLGIGMVSITLANRPHNLDRNSPGDKDKVQVFAEGSKFMWVGTANGLVKINKSNGSKSYFNRANSGLPSNDIRTLAIDDNGTKWIATDNGIAKYDGDNWRIYNEGNSDIPENDVEVMAIDKKGTVWIGTEYGGLAEFDGSKWKTYDKRNSGLPGNNIEAITIGDENTKWIGTFRGGPVKYDGESWTTY